MPFYEYQCDNCGYLFEELQTMSEAPLVKCPECGQDTLKKLIGTGSGLIFKGSGFYLTDYKNKKSSSSNSPSKEQADEAIKKDKAKKGSTDKGTSNKDSKKETKPGKKE